MKLIKEFDKSTNVYIVGLWNETKDLMITDDESGLDIEVNGKEFYISCDGFVTILSEDEIPAYLETLKLESIELDDIPFDYVKLTNFMGTIGLEVRPEPLDLDINFYDKIDLEEYLDHQDVLCNKEYYLKVIGAVWEVTVELVEKLNIN